MSKTAPGLTIFVLGSSFTFTGTSSTPSFQRALACAMLTRLGIDFRVGTPKLHPLDYAASELLEALKQIENLTTPSRAMDALHVAQLCAKARAAIAKVEGSLFGQSPT